MPAASDTFVLPPDYTFTPGGVLVHKAAYERLEKLVEKGQNRNPDMHGMYIYNDFFGYAILDLVDETLSSIHTFVVKKKWLGAWHALDALTKFNNMLGEWTNIDDGERAIITEKVYDALLITTIRGLDSATPSQFNETTIPDLELSLMGMAGWGEMMADTLDCCYDEVLKGYGRKLFGERTQEERESARAARRVAYEAFVQSLSPEEREERGDRIGGQAGANDDEDDDEDEDEEDESSKVWYGDADVSDAEYKDASFRITPAWKEYKACLAGSPRIPMRGPAIWDLTKWSAADKKQFSFHGGDDSGDEDMMDAGFF